MEEPVCLIENTTSGELQVNQEALDILSSIRQPVVVVSIVGMYRTGKSYLMNRLAGKRSGFSLGSTIQSETKGIWMWCVPHPCKNDHTLVLLDTEGLGNVEKGDPKNDTWIFALAVLLSSTLVYNSMGTINSQALMNLYYVTELTDHIKVKSGSEGQDETSSKYALFFPSFVWVVRDFTLDLVSNGKKITSDEYLENSMKLKTGYSKHTAASNDASECIQTFFPKRKCFVMYRPVSQNDLRILDQLYDTDLDPGFIQQATEFCKYIFDNSEKKMISEGTPVTGKVLGRLAGTYVDAIQSGTIPCLENAVLAVSQVENAAAVEQSYALYRRLLEERVVLSAETGAVKEEELSAVHNVCLEEALRHFKAQSFNDKEDKFQKDLKERIMKEYDGKCSENAALSFCSTLLQRLWDSLDHASYMRSGGYPSYRIQVDYIIQKYRATPGKGSKADQVLDAFMKAKERKKLERRWRDTEQKEEAERDRQAMFKRLEEEQERAHKEREKEMIEHMEREWKAAQEEQKKALEELWARFQAEREARERGISPFLVGIPPWYMRARE
ncbi:hypothetical protein AGOR_G00189610 [Albula goreensis]|uniref:GB1/RHD3-type G domain-containing protein n=1 Tax=Albula goreensis TaxID=1534307 RepID=A0A8T3CTS5_9TELE|nr:hypothetical protein AGOR_G00189610 [Albula goreensis]